MKHITINGKEYPFRLTIGAMVQYKGLTDEDFSQFKGDDMLKLGTIIFCGLESACRAEGVHFPFEDVYALMDYIDVQEAAALLGMKEEDAEAGDEKKS